MKCNRGILVLLVLAMLCIACVAGAENSSSLSWMNASVQPAAAYKDVKAEYAAPVYRGPEISVQMPLSMTVGNSYTVSFAVPETAQYEIWLTYKNTSQAILPTDVAIQLDRAYPFDEMHSVQFDSMWVDDGVFPEDRYGNQLTVIPYAADVWQQMALCDSAHYSLSAFLFELTEGQHELTLTVQDGQMDVQAISLRAPQAIPAYVGGDASGEEIIVIEGESISARNQSRIRAAGESTASLTPSSVERRVMNHLSGTSFYEAGDMVTYRFKVEQNGWYHFGAFYRQNARKDFPVYVDLLIDGMLPSQDAQEVAFDYTDSFEYMMAEQRGKALTFYLEEGEHTLSLRINAEKLTPLFRMIEEVSAEMNVLSQEVIRLSGGVTSDKYRNYDIINSIPDLPEILHGWADRCEEMLDYVTSLEPECEDTAFSYLTLSINKLRSLAKEPEELPRRIDELATGSSSATKYLAQLLLDLSNNALDIDQMYFYQAQAALPGKPNFLQSLMTDTQRFFHSFAGNGYSASRESEEGHLQVWMAESRLLVEALQNLIDTEFTPQTGIVVDLALMPSESKLVLSNAAGTAPDVALSLIPLTPSYLDIRGALYDLTQFEDFPAVAERFNSKLFVPYLYDEGVYALPQRINTWFLFYRTDIFQSLGIEVPGTIEELKEILPILQARGMNFYHPIAGMSGLKSFSGTLPLIYQHGGSIYGDSVLNTTLVSEASLKGFRELTELFTIHSLPVDAGTGFYQRFRDGTMPIGMGDITIYNQLNRAAPELNGLWDVAVIPGVEGEDGVISRWNVGNLQAMGIMANTDMPEEAWTFLKWWASAETQSTYANQLFTMYGEDTLWASANIEAFEQLPIKYAHKQVILEQMEWTSDAPWCLGTYMVERELSNAFLSVVVEGEDARRALDKAAKAINRETERKLEEFGYMKDGELLREYIAPDTSLIEEMIEQYYAEQEGSKP